MTRRAWLAVAALGFVLVAGSIAAVMLRPYHPARSEVPGLRSGILPAGPPECGQEVLRHPESGPGPIDGGLLVTGAQIPPITHPAFEPAVAARRWLPGDAPVVLVRVGDDVRAYPFAILEWHEVIDDTVGGRPLAITYCPLCNTALVYSRDVAGRQVQLQASGALLSGAAVLVDPSSRELWSQVTGEPLPNFGRIAPVPLQWYSSDTVSLDQAAASEPGLRVLARPAAFGFDYSMSPYGTVAAPGTLPAPYVGWVDEHLDPKTRLVGVTVRGAARAWQLRALAQVGLRNEVVAGQPVVVIYRPHVTGIGDSPDLKHAPEVGAAAVYSARLDGRTLHFRAAPNHTLRDRETGSGWDLTGTSITGPLAGTRLTPLQFVNTYWFAWIAFYPDSTVWPPVSASTCSVSTR